MNLIINSLWYGWIEIVGELSLKMFSIIRKTEHTNLNRFQFSMIQYVKWSRRLLTILFHSSRSSNEWLRSFQSWWIWDNQAIDSERGPLSNSNPVSIEFSIDRGQMMYCNHAVFLNRSIMKSKNQVSCSTWEQKSNSS